MSASESEVQKVQMERDPFKGIKGNNLLEPEFLKVSCNLESMVFDNCRIKMVVKCYKIGCSSKNPANAHLSLAALLLKQRSKWMQESCENMFSWSGY